jgi:hypothetical protein
MHLVTSSFSVSYRTFNIPEVEDDDSGGEKKEEESSPKKPKVEINIGSEHIKKMEVLYSDIN